MIKHLISWAIDRSAAMNALMLATIFAGLFSFGVMRREIFPEFELDIILVTVPYPGASPQVTEEGICQKLESAIQPIAGIKKLTSVAAEGMGYAVVELNTGEDAQKILNEIRSAIDRIPSLPELAENKDVSQITMRNPAIRVGILGPPNIQTEEAELELRNLTEEIRQELMAQKPIKKSGIAGLMQYFTTNVEQAVISQADIIGAKPYQIDVEISEQDLRQYGLTLKQVASIIRSENVDVPGGILRSEVGDVSLQANSKVLTGVEVAQLPLVRSKGEVVLRVGDIGMVRDGFADVDSIDRVNGRPTLVLSVMRTPSEDLLHITDTVKAFVEHRKKTMPPGYELAIWFDQSEMVQGRMDLLTKNGLQGLFFVFLVLALFLEFRLAFWVAMGIPISVLGAGIVLIYMGATINMLSLFAFLLALGIVVDDAIVIGENIYRYREQGLQPRDAAIQGTLEVLPAVTASVTTTVIAFLPLFFIAGVMGKFFAVLPIAVVAMLVISLGESMLILPCHLGHDDGPITRIIKWLSVPVKPFLWCIGKANQVATWCMQSAIRKIYLPSLRHALRFPLVPISIATGILFVSLVVVKLGVTPFILFPKVDSPMINAKVIFSDGTPVKVTDAATRELEDVIVKLLEEVSPDKKIFKVIHRAVGHTTGTAPPGPQGRTNGSFVGVVDVELVDSGLRSIDSLTLINRWRAMSPTYPDAESLIFSDSGGPGGPGGKQIEFKLLADAKYMDDLEKASEECLSFLRAQPGVYDLDNDINIGKEEFRFKVKEDAKAMGITSSQLADAVRGAYYGEEVMRLQRGRHEVKLMVRYPADERRSLLNLEDIRVRGNDRAERPITEVAEIEKVREYSELNRVNQLRSITISGDIDFSTATANQIFNGDVKNGKPSFNEFFENTIKKKYPSVFLMYEGQAQQQAEAVNSMITGFIVAMMVIFLVLTLQFKSYIQPFIIMAIMPFALIGVILGHYILTIPITLFSLCGIVALMGVVINDSIVLVDFINKRYEKGADIVEVLMEAGRARFRPVALTSITTVAGLFPILTETSLQATLLIPMAASLCFGLAIGTIMILYLVPVFYRIYIWSGDFFQKEILGMETTTAHVPTVANSDGSTTIPN